ncbi:MAG: nucleotidyltransferase domain-containing protein, partial [Bacteroidetes bacterium]|nr:nucleotidyltransferase domain-containing protein [Bacteroidota bacterium]
VIVLFGSQSRQTAHKNADYDVGIFRESGYDWRSFTVWKTHVEDLAWPYRIDLVDLTRAPREFLDGIKNDMIILSGNLDGYTLSTTET